MSGERRQWRAASGESTVEADDSGLLGQANRRRRERDLEGESAMMLVASSTSTYEHELSRRTSKWDIVAAGDIDLLFCHSSFSLLICCGVCLGWFGGTEKPNRANRHQIHLFSFMWKTDRLLISANRSLQDKPNRFVVNRLPRLNNRNTTCGPVRT
jgi:hypothetical protein